MEEEVFSLCFMCSIRCPIKVKVKDGQVTWIEGNPHVAGMEGSLCPRGAAGTSLLYELHVAPVHELETWATAAAGLGVLGCNLRRRNPTEQSRNETRVTIA